MNNITYLLYPDNPEAHTLTVILNIAEPSPNGQVLSLPTWIPGSYLLREFAKNIVSMTAENDQGPLTISRLNKSSWQVAATQGPLKVTTTVYAWDLSVRMAHFDQSHCYFNGTSLFLQVHGQEDQPHHVCINAPNVSNAKDWRVSTAMRKSKGAQDEMGWFEANDYDELIDHPVEMGTFEALHFEACGVPHEVAITGRCTLDKEKLIQDLKTICEGEIAFFGGKAPMERYVFQIMVVGAGYGGLEHRASTSLICNRSSFPTTDSKNTDNIIKFLGLCSHEYFHTWNVKRIKPAAFTPFDLSQENYTTLLWVFEGWTSYYDDLLLLRLGLISIEEYLKLVGKTLTRVRKGSGLHKQSLAESSYSTWTKFYRQDENAPNSIISYYAKGSLAALALDLKLRLETDGRISLDHVMKELWYRFGAQEIGVPEDGVETLAMELSGLDLREWFDQTIRGTGEIHIKTALSKFGIALNRRVPTSSKDLGGEAGSTIHTVSLGILGSPSAHSLKIKQVFDGGAAQQAGLSAGDTIIAIDGLQSKGTNWEGLLNQHNVGDTITVHGFRRDELFSRNITLQAPEETIHYLSMIPDVSKEIALRRSNWLGIQKTQ